MLAEAPTMTAEQVISLRHAAEERKEQERAAAKARKEKMMRLEEEARKQVRGTGHLNGTLDQVACSSSIHMPSRHAWHAVPAYMYNTLYTERTAALQAACMVAGDVLTAVVCLV